MSGAALYGDPQLRSAEEIKAMADQLAILGKECKYDVHTGSNIPYVRAVNYESKIVDHREWLRQVWRGELFPHNSAINRQDFTLRPFANGELPRKPRRMTNDEMWSLTDDIICAEMFHWKSISDLSTDIYPDVSHLIFRHKADFYCASWHRSIRHWLTLIQLLPNNRLKEEVFKPNLLI